jgi:hypothetical protein
MVEPTIFVNSTGVFGILLNAFTENITGSLFLTLLLILMFLLALCMMAQIPIEWTVVFMLPLLLYLMAYTSEFQAIGGFALIYTGIIIAKNWFGSKY